MVKFKAVAVKGKDLKPGDLFSTVGTFYWDCVDAMESLGERVYIRTNSPCPKSQEDVDVFVVTIEQMPAEEEKRHSPYCVTLIGRECDCAARFVQ